MGEGLYLSGINISGDILRLGFLGKYDRNIKILSYNTGDTDTGGLNGQDFVNFFIRKSSLKLFSDLHEQLNIHLVI